MIRTFARHSSIVALAAVVSITAGSPRATLAADATLIRNAQAHTMSARGVLEGADVLIQGGRIVDLGPGLRAPQGAEIIDAAGRPVTPGLFGGITQLGLEEIGFEPPAIDHALRMSAMRPELDIVLGYNADTVAVGINRAEGITYAMLAPSASAGAGDAPDGTIVSGQGGIVALDGSVVPLARALFIDLGGDTSGLAGGSRAAQYMLLRQALVEARNPNLVLVHDDRLLTPAGRQTLLDYAAGAGPIVVDVDRASDIRQVVAFAEREKLRVVIAGGAEAWRVAPELAVARIPVVLDPLENLPGSFDAVGATLENAARLHRAGVTIAFSLPPEPHNVAKLRQAAGVAAANGLPREAALAAITRVPAEIFGVAARAGSIDRGRPADLVLWSGDPLEVTSYAERVFVSGRAAPMRTRHTELRDRYLDRLRRNEAR
jgi:imidazolonepropionase-like amidohydrolase